MMFTDSLRIPERVQRPAATRKALGLTPLVQAGWADASGIERVPFMSAGTRPEVFFAGRPAAERAADARLGGFATLLFLNLAIQNN